MTAALGPPSFQYFVFDFHVSPDVMFDKIIKISVSVAQTAPLYRLEKSIPLDGPTIKRRPHVQTHSRASGAQAGLGPSHLFNWVPLHSVQPTHPYLAASKNEGKRG